MWKLYFNHAVIVVAIVLSNYAAVQARNTATSSNNNGNTTPMTPDLVEPRNSTVSGKALGKFSNTTVMKLTNHTAADPVMSKEEMTQKKQSVVHDKHLQYKIGAYIFATCFTMGMIWLVVSHVKTKRIMKRYNRDFTVQFSAIAAYNALIQTNQLSYEFRGDGNILLKKTNSQTRGGTTLFENFTRL